MRSKKAKRRPAAREFIPSEPRNAAPVGNAIRVRANEPLPFGYVRPPLGDLDKAADRKLTGGFSTRRKNICGTCFTARSKNGVCECRNRKIPAVPRTERPTRIDCPGCGMRPSKGEVCLCP